MCTALRSSACLSNPNSECPTRVPGRTRGVLAAFGRTSTLRGNKQGGQPALRSSQGITIVWKACGVCVRSFSVSPKRSADRSSPAALRTREKEVSNQRHLTGAPPKGEKRNLRRGNLIRRRGKRKSFENASGTDCGAMAHDGTSAARNGGNET